jgi:pimeloyl-ACP methyl ester carboxylesterase
MPRAVTIVLRASPVHCRLPVLAVAFSSVVVAFLLSFSTRAAAQSHDGWTDPSPHTQQFVAVDSNTSIELLDWGGSGRPLVLLAQLGQTAHIYDEWAPKLARRYRVVGITRRGYGQSSRPSDGYSIERLASDILAALDAEKLQVPVLVGHGFAGEEMSWIGARFPNRLAGLIYLDAAYDRTNVAAEGAIVRRIPQPRPPRPEDMESAQALTRWMSAGMGFPIPESEVRQLAQIGADGRVIGERTPASVRQQIFAGLAKADYRSIQVPVLAIYAKRTSEDSFPGCRGAADADAQHACRELFDWTSRQLKDSEAIVRTIPSRVHVIELANANSFVFLSNERDVMRAIDRFVSAMGK